MLMNEFDSTGELFCNAHDVVRAAFPLKTTWSPIFGNNITVPPSYVFVHVKIAELHVDIINEWSCWKPIVLEDCNQVSVILSIAIEI